MYQILCTWMASLCLQSGVQRSSEPSDKCWIITLPDELLVQVFGYISALDREIFALTCTVVRAARSPRRLSRKRRLEILARKAKDFPEHWACDYCIAIHPVNYRDTPRARLKISCHPKYLRRPPLRPRHHHVQFAWKLSRLSSSVGLTPIQQRYLEHLLETTYDRHTEFRHGGMFFAADSKVGRKIRNGRYLTKQVLRVECWNNPRRDLSKDDQAVISPCQHMQLRYPDVRPYVGNAWLPGIQLDKWDESLELAFQWAEEHPKTDVVGCCQYCATDFSVKAIAKGTLVVRFWRDMGLEGPRADLRWRIFAVRGRVSRDMDHHTSGSIRNAYENRTRRRVPLPWRKTFVMS